MPLEQNSTCTIVFSTAATEHPVKGFNSGAAGGPRSLRVLLEGESLLNDASSITLFTIFLRKVEEYTHGEDTQSGLAVFGDVCKQTVWLAVGALQPCQLSS